MCAARRFTAQQSVTGLSLSLNKVKVRLNFVDHLRKYDAAWCKSVYFTSLLK